MPTFGNTYLQINNLLPYIGIVYLWVLFGYAIQFILQIIQLRRIKHTADFTKHNALFCILNNITKSIPINIKIGVSSKIHTPIVFGYWEPVILLPISICTYLSTDQIKLVVLHELAHITRNDFIIQFLLRLVQCIIWFNPFAHAMHSAIQLQREMSCDEWVIKKTHSPIPYSKALFQLANQLVNANSKLSIGAASNQPDLLLRLQYLNCLPVNYPRKFSLHFIFWLLMGIGYFLLSNNSSTNIQPSIAQKRVTVRIQNSLSKAQINKVFIPLTTIAIQQTSTLFTKHLKPIKVDHAMASSTGTNYPQNEVIHYNDLVNQTKLWIQSRENPARYAGYDETSIIEDSIENIIIDKLVLISILNNYQLKRTLMQQKIASATNPSEAADYLYNSKEWNEIIQYEQWAREYLQKH